MSSYEEYCSTHAIRKLHIGCGRNILADWLNSDLLPSGEGVVPLDATQPFPFESRSFDYIFSEHMIEHISYSQGSGMLIECFRILKEGGKIRISTPDLKFLIDLYTDNESDLKRRYIEWATDKFIPDCPYYHAIFVINNFMRNFQHVFIYDMDTLRRSMAAAGFSRIAGYPLHESDDPVFRHIEHEGRMPPGFLRLETISVEGVKIPKR